MIKLRCYYVSPDGQSVVCRAANVSLLVKKKNNSLTLIIPVVKCGSKTCSANDVETNYTM